MNAIEDANICAKMKEAVIYFYLFSYKKKNLWMNNLN